MFEAFAFAIPNFTACVFGLAHAYRVHVGGARAVLSVCCTLVCVCVFVDCTPEVAFEPPVRFASAKAKEVNPPPSSPPPPPEDPTFSRGYATCHLQRAELQVDLGCSSVAAYLSHLP